MALPPLPPQPNQAPTRDRTPLIYACLVFMVTAALAALLIWHSERVAEPLGLSLKSLLGLVFSLLLAYLTKLLLALKAHDRALETLVSQRTLELAAREADLQRAQAVARVGSWVIDETGNGPAWSASAETYRIMGWREGVAFAGLADLIECVHPEDRPAVAAACRGRQRSHRTVIEFRVLVDAGTRWVGCQAERLGGADGTADGTQRIVGTVQDITERKRAEQDTEIAATAFETQEGIVVTDAQCVILRINHAFTEITGYSTQQAVGQHVGLLRSGRQDAAFYAAMWQHINRTGSWKGEVWNRRHDGEGYPGWLTITAVKGDGAKVTHYVGTLSDITQRKAAEDEIRHLAFYDALTQLANRRLLVDRLQHALAGCTRSLQGGALLFIDLDQFKILNDTHGHDKGDMLLVQVAQRLTECVRETDTVARLGGDEFVVMLEALSPLPQAAMAQARTIAKKILAKLNEPYRLGDLDYRSTPSIGVTMFSQQATTVIELLKQADLAMYEAKANGRNTLRFFSTDMHASAPEPIAPRSWADTLT